MLLFTAQKRFTAQAREAEILGSFFSLFLESIILTFCKKNCSPKRSSLQKSEYLFSCSRKFKDFLWFCETMPCLKWMCKYFLTNHICNCGTNLKCLFLINRMHPHGLFSVIMSTIIVWIIEALSLELGLKFLSLISPVILSYTLAHFRLRFPLRKPQMICFSFSFNQPFQFMYKYCVPYFTKSVLN